MERIPESEYKNRSITADVYYGLDTLCASMGAAILLVGGTTAAVAIQHPAQNYLLNGCIGIVLGVALLAAAAVLTMRSGDDP